MIRVLFKYRTYIIKERYLDQIEIFFQEKNINFLSNKVNYYRQIITACKYHGVRSRQKIFTSCKGGRVFMINQTSSKAITPS